MGGHDQPVGAAFERDAAGQAIERGDELRREIGDRQPAEIDALALGEVEQQVERPVEAVEVGTRGGESQSSRSGSTVGPPGDGTAPSPARPASPSR